MTDDTKKKPDERPLDPTRDVSDIVGDTTGFTGMTTGNPKDISAEPGDIPSDVAHLPGGIQDVKDPPEGSLGVPKDSYSKKIYDKKINEGMSAPYAEISQNLDSDTLEEAVESSNNSQSGITEQGAQTVNSDENARKDDILEIGTNADPLTEDQGEFAAEVSPEEAGEQSVSGDMPTPDSDDDTLANAKAVGTQLDEDEEHPEEIDIARDIDEAEEYTRTH